MRIGAVYRTDHFESEEMKFPEILESWQYRNPEDIADGLIARTAKAEKIEARKAELHRIHRRRRIKALVRQVKRNGGSSIG